MTTIPNLIFVSLQSQESTRKAELEISQSQQIHMSTDSRTWESPQHGQSKEIPPRHIVKPPKCKDRNLKALRGKRHSGGK